MGSDQEATCVLSSAVTRLRAWTANDGMTIKAFTIAWCSMVQESGAGLGQGRTLSVSRFESE
jgi:hypothetical protein